MPFVVSRTDQCPTSRPYGVFTETGHQTGKTAGKPHGCFPTEAAARQQQKALYANVPDAKSAAPSPPNLRASHDAIRRCGTCQMFDHAKGVCWGYGNVPVQPGQVCDSYSPERPEREERMTTTTTAPKAPLTNTIAARKARLGRRGELEHRTLPVEEMEVRSGPTMRVADDTTGAENEIRLLEFQGYASVFNRSYSVGGVEETVEPGAFKRSLGNPALDVVLRTQHSDLPLARTTGRVTLSDGSETPTLSLAEDDRGLHVRALLDPTDPDVQRLVPKYRRGDLREMSFAFRCKDDVWSEDYTQRSIRAADIHRGDVSIVTYGASPVTDSTLRSEDAAQELRSIGASGLIGSMQDFAFQWVASFLTKRGQDATMAELEARAGKVLSSQSMDSLRRVLELVSTADDCVDEAQPLLADLMGVPNPDTDDDSDDADDVPSQLGHLSESDDDQEARQKTEPSPNEGDRARTPAHLMDTVLSNLAHANQHLQRLKDSDVLSSVDAQQFNVDHLDHHMRESQEHVHKLDHHLQEFASDPQVFRSEREQITAQRAEEEAATAEAATSEASAPEIRMTNLDELDALITVLGARR